MSISKYNSEGYLDLTTYEALTKVEKEEKKAAFKPLVYICSPFSGDTETNINKAREYCRFAIKQNCIPLAPHLLFPQFMDDENPCDRELALFMDLVLMSKCCEVWVFGETVSKGMSIEIAKAEKKKQTIRYFNSNYMEVCDE